MMNATAASAPTAIDPTPEAPLAPVLQFEPENLPRILLVDDEPRLLSSLYELLRDRDYHLVTASCGAEALAHLSRVRFDLVLLDLRLPDMSGHDIMDFINEKGIEADVIVMSGEVGIDAAIGALKRGAYDYLRKPYSREELLKTVANALQQRRLEPANLRIASQLENSEKLYRYLVDSSPDIIYTLNHEGRFTFVNDRAYQLLGFAREELIGKHYSILVHEEDLERARYVFNERRVDERASRNVELRLKCHAGGSQDRTFNNTLMTISLNSIGMHVPDGDVKKLEFFGTYGVARDITDRKRAEEVISYQAYHDILTDLPNRMLFKDRLGLAVIQAKRKLTELAVMFIDLDRFKLVNDTLGHVKGDELLQQVAVRLKDCLRRGDTLARQGGDEFTIVLPELRDREDAKLIADKFLECLHKPFDLDGHEVHISASIGIAIYPGDGESIDELLRHADIAMYQVKALGKNGHSFYHNSMLDISHQKIALEQSLRKALEQNELEMYYQPQIDVITGRIIGAEGLMRWNHPHARPADRRRVPAVRRREWPDAADLRLDDRRPVPRYAAVERLRRRSDPPVAEPVAAIPRPRRLLREDARRAGALRDFAGPDRSRDHREHLHPQSAVRDRAAQQTVPARRLGGDRRFRHRLFVAVVPAPLPDPHHQDRPVVRQGDPRRARPLSGDPGDHLDRARPRPAPDRRRRRDRRPGALPEGERLPDHAGLPVPPPDRAVELHRPAARAGCAGGRRACARAAPNLVAIQS